MNSELHPITPEMLMAYADNALYPDTMQRVRERLEADASARAAYEALCENQAALLELGNELRQIAPGIDMVGSVMDAAQRAAQDEREVEAELESLGDMLRMQAPKISIAEAVMQHLPGQEVVSSPHRLESALLEIGEELRARAPRVEISEQVLHDVQLTHQENIIPMASSLGVKAQQRHKQAISWRFIAAAAACIVAGLGALLVQMINPAPLGRLEMARNSAMQKDTASKTSQAQSRSAREGEPLEFTHVPASEELTLFSSVSRPASVSEVSDDETPETGNDVVFSVEDIIAARREALGGKSESLAMLARWGALDPDEVRRLLAEGIIDPSEIAGLSRFLPEEEARSLLQQAIAMQPEDPSLRQALARRLMNDPTQYAEMQRQLTAFKELAPENSLPYYMDAQARMMQGDYAGAMQALEYAGSLNYGSAYALENAQNHSAALQAAGMSPEVAQMLAAFNAGSDEYAGITQLSYDLLSYGAYFESVGDYDTALSIYKSVQRMGVQINQGARFTNEQLAGVDVQMAALDAISAMAGAMTAGGQLPSIDGAYSILMESLNIFLDNSGLLDNLIAGTDMEFILQAIQQIMNSGELRYLRTR